jgi:hypothetical protein
MAKNPIQTLRGLAVAADIAFVDVTTNIEVQEWTVKATIDRKYGKQKKPSEWQGYMCETVINGDEKVVFPINGELFRKLEKDSGTAFFEVEDDKYLLINTTFGVKDGVLIA